MPKLRAHHKVWLVGATFALGSLVVLVLMTGKVASEVQKLRSIEQRSVPQQQALAVALDGLNTTRISLTDAVEIGRPVRTGRPHRSRRQRGVIGREQVEGLRRAFLALATRGGPSRALHTSSDRGRARRSPAGLAIVNAPPGAPVAVNADLSTDLAAVDAEIAVATTLQRSGLAQTAAAVADQRREIESSQSFAPLAVVITLLLGFAVTYASARSVRRQEVVLQRQEHEREESARRNEFDARLGRALEMAESEGGAFDIVAQALGEVVGDDSAELLLADSSRAHFQRILVTPADGEGCGVATPTDCPAAQRSTTLVFPSNRALDACPHLRELETDCSAVCLPVTVGSQAIGVVHVGAALDHPPSKRTLGDLGLVAQKTGDRVGMLRAFADSESQARTDPLTGLLNRRSLENRVRDLVTSGTSYTVAYGDLDQFKDLNDRHGHETGDRALRLFARVLRDSIRPADLPGRFGGEEFLVVLPDCGVDAAVAVIERVREQLALALADGALPPFTASFGVAPGRPDTTFDATVAEADAALYTAKRSGRNRVVGAPEPSERDTVSQTEPA